MKFVFVILRVFITIGGLFFLGENMFAQLIQPSAFVEFPDIHPDSLNIYRQDSIQFTILQRNLDVGLIDFAHLSDADQNIYTRGTRIAGGYFSTAPADCSIYCVIQPEIKPCINHTDLAYERNNALDAVHDFNLQTGLKFDVSSIRDACFAIEMAVPKGSMLSEIVLFNGMCTDLKTWKEHGRIKDFEVWMNNSLIGTFRLEDTWRGQKFPLKIDMVEGSYKQQLTIYIRSWHKTGPGKLVALSEINFIGNAHTH